MSLSKDTVAHVAPQFTNTLGEREIDLRGHALTQLPAHLLEVLVASFDVVDLSNNKLFTLDDFTLLLPTQQKKKEAASSDGGPDGDEEQHQQQRRTSTLVLHNNQLVTFPSSLALALPNLHSLVLHNNSVARLEHLFPLASCKRLERVSMMGNPVARLANYRAVLIKLCPSLKLIDFNRVLEKERTAAKSLDLSAILLSSSSMAAASTGAAGTAATGAVAADAAGGAFTRRRKKQAAQNGGDGAEKHGRDGVADETGERDGAKKRRSDGNKLPQQQQKVHTREELERRLEEASSIEEIEEIEKLLALVQD